MNLSCSLLDAQLFLYSLTLPSIRSRLWPLPLLKSIHLISYSCYRVGGGWFMINYYGKDSPFLSLEIPPPHTHLLGSQCLPPEERRLSMPETGEKERNSLFKSYTDLE